MKYFLFASALLMATAVADDRLRDVQAELKSQGFFYGAVDGKSGAETTAAVRRFQIRNGLTVTGALNDETLGALGMGGSGKPSPTPPAPTKDSPPKEPSRSEPPAPPKKKSPDQLNPPAPGETRPSLPPTPPRAKDLLREDRPPAPNPEEPPYRPVKPRVVPGGDPNIVPPPRPVPAPIQDDFATFYHGTPYANAPREVQVDVLRKAQEALAARRLYRAEPDGLPGPATNEALFLYQEQRQLSRTGRLDLATLSNLSLLPGRSPDAPPLKPFYNPNRRHDPSVDVHGTIR